MVFILTGRWVTDFLIGEDYSHLQRLPGHPSRNCQQEGFRKILSSWREDSLKKIGWRRDEQKTNDDWSVAHISSVVIFLYNSNSIFNQFLRIFQMTFCKKLNSIFFSLNSIQYYKIKCILMFKVIIWLLIYHFSLYFIITLIQYFLNKLYLSSEWIVFW